MRKKKVIEESKTVLFNKAKKKRKLFNKTRLFCIKNTSDLAHSDQTKSLIVTVINNFEKVPHV